jgi:hypothetical protein
MAPMIMFQQRILICRIYEAFFLEALMGKDHHPLRIQTQERGLQIIREVIQVI